MFEIVFPSEWLIYVWSHAIEMGVYPVNWKRGNIVPVRKNESKNLVYLKDLFLDRSF